MSKKKLPVHKHTQISICIFTRLTLPVTITSKRIAYALWSVRNSVPFSVLKYLANLHTKEKTEKVKTRKKRTKANGRNWCKEWAPLPEIKAFGDSIFGKWCIQSSEGVFGYTFFNVQVQVTLPLNVYSYFSALKRGRRKKDSHIEALQL